MKEGMMKHLELEVDLRAAVERREFEIEYQPIVNLVTGEVHGAEAVVRWDHATRGDVQQALSDSGLEPWALTLEITESVLMHTSEAMLERLRALKGLGLNLAIDDFGTGYSSLGYLQQVPLAILKIDRSFVEAVGT